MRRERTDQEHAPLEILDPQRGQPTETRELHYAFERKNWQRRINSKGFIRLGKWKVYMGVEGILEQKATLFI